MIYYYFFGKLCKSHSVVHQDLEQHPELPRTVFNFKVMFFQRNVQIKLLADMSTK